MTEEMTKAERIHAREMKLSLMKMLEGIRVRNGLRDYPKATMTEAMAVKGTALINCGEEEKKALKISEGIMESYEARLYTDLYKAYEARFERDTRRNLYNIPVPCVRLNFNLRRAK